VELIDVGASNNWDAHGDMKTHEPLAKNIDRPIYGLLQDLKSRGLLEDTLVVWTSEFGRSPWPDSPKGRSHHNLAYSSWIAGGGIKPGIVYGQSDEMGWKVASDDVHVHDFHATLLQLLGFDHTKLTFRHAGRDYRLTDVAGNVVKKILA
jgi:arylsulfatase A-like enzyme